MVAGKILTAELVEIVRQSSDSGFAQLLSRTWEGQQTNNDVIKAQANTGIVEWWDEFVKVYCNYYLAGQENEGCIGKLDSEVATIKAQDSSNKDIETKTCSLSIPHKIGLSQTANLPSNWNYLLVQW